MTIGNTITVKPWNNGTTVFGIVMLEDDRDNNFTPGEITVIVHLPNGTTSKTRIAENSGFWRDCPELRSRKDSPEIENWLIEKGYVKNRKKNWERPLPEFTLEKIGENEFKLTD